MKELILQIQDNNEVDKYTAKTITSMIRLFTPQGEEMTQKGIEEDIRHSYELCQLMYYNFEDCDRYEQYLTCNYSASHDEIKITEQEFLDYKHNCTSYNPKDILQFLKVHYGYTHELIVPDTHLRFV